MKPASLLIIVSFLFVVLSTQTTFSQIPKIKIPKPKPQPTPEAQPTTPAGPTTDREGGTIERVPSIAPQPVSKGTGPYAVQPQPPASPQFLVDTLKIDLELWDYYYKIANDNHNTSWAPRINFQVFYGGSTKLRYKADYYMPDGSLWFSEALEEKGINSDFTHTSNVGSPSDSNSDKRAIVVGGVFGLKITNIRDNSTVFQGKFKVARFKPQYSDARYKNEVDYYVDNDWRLPIGLTDVEYERDYAIPSIRMWFKGDLNRDNLEARLFRNGQEISTTDDNPGGVSSEDDYYAKKRGDDKSLFWREFKFSWPKKILFIMTENVRDFTAQKNSLFINQMPGEYVVKIYFNGEQVRETKFTIGNDGTYADNGIAKQNNLSTNRIILPVKVMGTLDKWNPVNAKAMGFYGNPVAGLN